MLDAGAGWLSDGRNELSARSVEIVSRSAMMGVCARTIEAKVAASVGTMKAGVREDSTHTTMARSVRSFRRYRNTQRLFRARAN